VLDLGANHGEFSTAMARRYGARGVAVEPNPMLEVVAGGFTVIGAAVAATDGPVDLAVGGNDQASTIMAAATGATTVRHDVVRGATLTTLLDESGLSHIDLLKMDIEGMEIVALGGVSDDYLERVDQITVEYHDSQRLTEPAEIAATNRRLARAGFMTVRMSVRHQGDVLYVRRALLSRGEQVWVPWVERPWALAKRAVSRGWPRLRRFVAGGAVRGGGG
jgi:FkbM family methyltransferase